MAEVLAQMSQEVNRDLIKMFVSIEKQKITFSFNEHIQFILQEDPVAKFNC